MHRFDPERRPLVLLAAALLAGGALAAGSHRRVVSAHGMAVPSPYELAGRLQRASPPGGYVDVHGPFDAAEEVLLRQGSAGVARGRVSATR